ncbi:MAG TPA: hypothetical protein VMD03_10385 [Steroidobacteraceae bacterium]|nr:hypothetical protein [Steroidobacteraceae bacterium]
MVLANQPTYPQSRAYVLKLHCDAAPAEGRFSGLIENVATGKRVVFSNAEELIATLVRDAIDLSTQTDTSSADSIVQPNGSAT